MRILNISVALLVYSHQATIKANRLQSTEFCDEAPFHHPNVPYCEHCHLLIYVTMSLQPPLHYSATLVPIISAVSNAF